MPSRVLSLLFVFALAAASPARAESESGSGSQSVSPSRQIEPRVRDDRRRSDRWRRRPASVRTIDGSGNHREHEERNAAHTPLIRMVAAEYADTNVQAAVETL